MRNLLLLLLACVAHASADQVEQDAAAGGSGSGRGIAGHLITGAAIGAMVGFLYATLRGRPERYYAALGAGLGALALGLLGW